MKCSFKDFEFDCEQQLLTQNGKVVLLNEKPARLLTLFLSDVDKVHAKEDILDYVWSGRVVTEQVVFQNVSYLRGLFGQESIKTFTRKGYQWQLPICEVSTKQAEIAETSKPNKPSKSTDAKQSGSAQAGSLLTGNKQLSPTVKRPMFMLLSICLLILLFFVTGKPTNTDINQSRVLTSSDGIYQLADYDVRSDSENGGTPSLIITKSPNLITNQAIFDSPFTTWQGSGAASHDLLLATKSYELNDANVLRFYIQGKARGWQGYVLSKETQSNIQKLNALLARLSSSQYFMHDSDHAALAELTLLHNENPSNFIITHQLISLHSELGYLDRATALINSEISNTKDDLNTGLLNLLKAKVTMGNNNWQSSTQSMNKSVETFQRLKLLHLESSALIEASWGKYFRSEHQESMLLLNLAASKAREANEPLLEVNARSQQAYLAGKTKQYQFMYTQMDLAKQLISLYELSDVHKIALLYYQAWNSVDIEDAIGLYKTILDSTFSPLYKHYFYSAAAAVLNHHIIKQEWTTANESMRAWQRESFVLLGKARVAFAQQDDENGARYAIDSFRRAQIDYQLKDALDAALLILQKTDSDNKTVTTAEFIGFIKQNSTHRWLRQNKNRLENIKEKYDVASF